MGADDHSVFFFVLEIGKNLGLFIYVLLLCTFKYVTNNGIFTRRKKNLLPFKELSNRSASFMFGMKHGTLALPSCMDPRAKKQLSTKIKTTPRCRVTIDMIVNDVIVQRRHNCCRYLMMDTDT